MPSLVVDLEVPLPSSLGVGTGNYLFLRGRCYDREQQLRRLSITVDERSYPVRVHSVAVPEVLDGTISVDERAHVLTSRFWARVPFGPGDAGRDVTIGVRAVLADGRVATEDLGRVSLVAHPRAYPVERAARLAICTAVSDPHIDLLETQRATLDGQGVDWAWIIVDDRSPEGARAALAAFAGGDERITLVSNDRRLGPVASLEIALASVPPGTKYVTVTQAHTTWPAGALAAAMARLDSGASGVAVADDDLELDVSSLLLDRRRLEGPPVIRAAVLEWALPFPPDAGAFDPARWLIAAAAAGGPGPVRGPGRRRAPVRVARTSPRASRGALRTALASAARRGSTSLSTAVAQSSVLAATLILRGSGRRRDLDAIARADRSLAAALRVPRSGDGPGPFASGALMRLLTLRFRSAGPAVLGPRTADATARTPEWLGRHLDKIEHDMAPLRLHVSPDATPRLNIVVPMLDIRYVFGAYLTIFHIAMAMRARGTSVRLLVVQEPLREDAGLRQHLLRYPGLETLLDVVEIEDVTDRARTVAVSPRDVFMATTSWTAYVASAASRELGAERFPFLILEYDPLVFPTGSLRELSAVAYDLPHVGIFSTELLRRYFRAGTLGVYAAGADGDALSVAIDNPVDRYDVDGVEIVSRPARRILFYARVEEHAERNLFEIAALALRRVARSGQTLSGVAIDGIGSLQPFTIDLGDGATLNVLARVSLEEYGALLPSYDVGIALQATPHPGLVPLDMAAAGLVTVTNAFATKQAADLVAISSNLIAPEPTVSGVADAIVEALARSSDGDARVRGSQLSWPRTWDEALAPVSEALIRLLGPAS